MPRKENPEKFESLVGEVVPVYKNHKPAKIQIKSSEDVANYIRQVWDGDLNISESFYVVFVNRANRVIAWSLHSRGGIIGTTIDIRIIMYLAINTLASGVVLVHNHPSGNTRPSEKDKEITLKIANRLSLLDIEVLDHIILTSDTYLSFRDEGIPVNND